MQSEWEVPEVVGVEASPFHRATPTGGSDPGPEVDEISETIQQIKTRALEEGWQAILSEPDLLKEFSVAFLAKELGIDPPELPTWEERLKAEVREDPDYRQGEIDRMVEGRRQDNLFHWLRRMRQIAEAMAPKREAAHNDAGAEVARAFKELMAGGGLRDLVQAFKAGRMQPADDASPSISDATMVGIAGLARASMEAGQPTPAPVVVERPPEPVRRSVGVPPEALGLLAFGQDDEFIDRPLV